MKAPEFQRQIDFTRHGNEALPLVLGAITLLERLESAIPAAEPDKADVPAVPEDDPAVLALLGLISVGRTLRGWVEEAQDEPDDEAESGEAASAIGDVMR